jgi:hypothetical protein
MPRAATNNNRLPQIAKAIKTLEKRNISNCVEIGKLLDEAANQCEHGEYMNWLKREFGWSYMTAKRYRDVFDLQQIHQIGDFAKLDISISALYVVATLMKDGSDGHVAVSKAIIEAARHGRVSYQMAVDTCIEYDRKHREPEPTDEDDDDLGQPLPRKHGPVSMRIKPLGIIEGRVSGKIYDIRVLIRDARKEIEPVVDRLQRRPTYDNWVPEMSKQIVKAIEGLQKLLELMNAADHLNETEKFPEAAE